MELLTPASRAHRRRLYRGREQRASSSLGARPFEYLLLRQQPQPWRDEDSFLVVLSMFITLQDTDGSYESTLGTMHDVLPEPMYEFLAPRGTEWDAPVVGETFSTPPIPGPDVYNLRARAARAARRCRCPSARPRRVKLPTPELPTPKLLRCEHGLLGHCRLWDLGVGIWELGVAHCHAEAIGSNNWAVSGALSADGNAIVANDMHLFIRVPNTWYRASMEWPDAAEPVGPARPDRRHAAWRSGARHRKQHAHRVGLHQHLRGLERPRRARNRSRQSRIATGRRTAGASSSISTKRSP